MPGWPLGSRGTAPARNAMARRRPGLIGDDGSTHPFHLKERFGGSRTRPAEKHGMSRRQGLSVSPPEWPPAATTCSIVSRILVPAVAVLVIQELETFCVSLAAPWRIHVDRKAFEVVTRLLGT